MINTESKPPADSDRSLGEAGMSNVSAAITGGAVTLIGLGSVFLATGMINTNRPGSVKPRKPVVAPYEKNGADNVGEGLYVKGIPMSMVTPRAIVTPTATSTEVPVTPTATSTEVPVTPTATSTEVPVTPTATSTEVPVTPTATSTREASETLSRDTFPDFDALEAIPANDIPVLNPNDDDPFNEASIVEKTVAAINEANNWRFMERVGDGEWFFPMSIIGNGEDATLSANWGMTLRFPVSVDEKVSVTTVPGALGSLEIKANVEDFVDAVVPVDFAVNGPKVDEYVEGAYGYAIPSAVMEGPVDTIVRVEYRYKDGRVEVVEGRTDPVNGALMIQFPDDGFARVFFPVRGTMNPTWNIKSVLAGTASSFVPGYEDQIEKRPFVIPESLLPVSQRDKN